MHDTKRAGKAYILLLPYDHHDRRYAEPELLL